MRLLIDARSLADPNHGGIGRVSRALIEAYADRFPEDELLLATTGSQTPSPERFPQKPNCRHLHITIPNKLWSLFSLFNLVSLEREGEKRVGNIDAIFLPNLGFIGALKKPYVLLLHDLSFLIEPRWFSKKMRLWHRAVRAEKTIRGATHLLAVSETTRQDAKRLLRIPQEHVSVIPIGVTLPSYPVGAMHELPLPLKNQGRYILILASDDPRKNAATVLAAVQEVKRDPAFADLDVIALDKTNKPSDQELASLYKQAAVFVYPSWYEGYGLPLHEAARLGIPCIASTAGALPETAPKGTLFADPAKPHHWVMALRAVLERPCPTKTSINASRWTLAAEILKKHLSSATN